MTGEEAPGRRGPRASGAAQAAGNGASRTPGLEPSGPAMAPGPGLGTERCCARPELQHYQIGNLGNSRPISQNHVSVRIKQLVVIQRKKIGRIENDEQIAAGRVNPIDADV